MQGWCCDTDLEYSKMVGAAVRALRLAKGLTRSALAKIECGQRSIYPDELKALHEALQVPYEALLQ